MPVRCPDCGGLAYRHHRRERWNERARCGLTRSEAFAKARWKRDGWVRRAFAQRGVGGPRIVWEAVQHRSDPDLRAMGEQVWLGPWRPVGPPWTSYVYGSEGEDGPDPEGSGPPPPDGGGTDGPTRPCWVGPPAPPDGGGTDEKSAPDLGPARQEPSEWPSRPTMQAEAPSKERVEDFLLRLFGKPSESPTKPKPEAPCKPAPLRGPPRHGETRECGRCDVCGTPVYLRASLGAVSARVEWWCNHGPRGPE